MRKKSNSQQLKQLIYLVDIYEVAIKEHSNIVNSSFRNGDSLGKGVNTVWSCTTAKGAVEFYRMLWRGKGLKW